MIHKKIVLKEGVTLILREPTEVDAQAMIDHVRTVSAETPFLSYTEGEFDMSLEEEKAFIKKTSAAPNAIFILAEVDGDIVGVAGIHGSEKIKEHHAGTFGISVQKSTGEKESHNT